MVSIFSEKRRRKLDELRREHAVESAALTPEERMRRSDELRQMAWTVQPMARSSSDESLEIMKSWKRRVRERR